MHTPVKVFATVRCCNILMTTGGWPMHWPVGFAYFEGMIVDASQRRGGRGVPQQAEGSWRVRSSPSPSARSR